MPTGYASEGKTYSRKLGRWLPKLKEKVFDYLLQTKTGVFLLINFFRWYPDYYADINRSPNAKYKLEIPQRLMMRVMIRYKNVYITGVRGLTKTYSIILTKMIEGVLYPGVVSRYSAPAQKQAAQLAATAFHQIERDYPAIANMWRVCNDREGMFKIRTNYGSELTMYAPRGDNSHCVVGEECGQEGKDAFPINDFINDVYPAVREVRMINQKPDKIYIQNKHTHIGNACSKTNQAFTTLRYSCLKDMASDNPYEGYILDIPWETALLGNLRNIEYFKTLKRTLSPEDWLRECCARYIGNGQNPLIPDEVLSRSRKNMIMEDCHSGNENAIYIIAHDVSYAGGSKNAQCADVVLKLTKYKSLKKRDKYRKQVVWLNGYPPPPTAYEQAQIVKKLWAKYSMQGGQPTYIVVDSWQYGTEVVAELMKPCNDGLPPLSCCVPSNFNDIAQPNAIPVIYPLKAGTTGTKDEEGAMIQYAQAEFSNGYVELLTGAKIEGLEAYKDYHGIKDDFADRQLKLPYDKTEELCYQIANLETQTSGFTLKEKRKSKVIQRDLWSALKYALRYAALLEEKLRRENYVVKEEPKLTMPLIRKDTARAAVLRTRSI